MSEIYIKPTQPENTIEDQRQFNNENWSNVAEGVGKALNKKDQTVHIGNEPPENEFAKVWIDTSVDYTQNYLAYCSVGPEAPIDPNVVLWLDTSKPEGGDL